MMGKLAKASRSAVLDLFQPAAIPDSPAGGEHGKNGNNIAPVLFPHGKERQPGWLCVSSSYPVLSYTHTGSAVSYGGQRASVSSPLWDSPLQKYCSLARRSNVMLSKCCPDTLGGGVSVAACNWQMRKVGHRGKAICVGLSRMAVAE